jgi:two-component system LytT family sensor kinase
MDYMLYESDDALGYLYKDIENLEDYIGLERIRQGNEARIDFRVTGITASQRIVPLLLLPLVENGFKHGIHSQIHDAWLEVDLQVDKHAVELSVVNSFRSTGENGRSGIGLVNLKRRLELFYPGKHSLETARSENEFSATLKIILE